jgi:hypothetical protein
MSRPARTPRPAPAQPPVSPPVEPPASPEPRRALDVLGIVVCAASAVLAAIITVLLTPLYWGSGSVLAPVSVLLAIVANVALPLLTRWLGASPIASGVPFVLWLLAVLVLGTSRPEGDVLLPAGSGSQQWVTYGMMAAGALAGSITVVTLTMGQLPTQAAPSAPTLSSKEPGSPERR